MTGKLPAQASEDETPRMVKVELREFLENGILMAVNERVLWPLGMALRVQLGDDGSVADLDVVRWRYPDGHREIIETADDEIAQERRRRFETFVKATAMLMTVPGEDAVALQVLDR